MLPTNNDNKIVRFTNIAPFDFTPEMGAMYGGVPYSVSSGKSLLMPFTIGDHLATHLARQIIIQKAPIRDEKEIDGKGSDRHLWDDGAINDLKAKIVREVYEEEKQPVASADQLMKEKVEELNRSDILPEQPLNTAGYKDKAEVVTELNKRGVKFDARKSKADLEKLLAEPVPV
jgi:hypothetical protein